MNGWQGYVCLYVNFLCVSISSKQNQKKCYLFLYMCFGNLTLMLALTLRIKIIAVDAFTDVLGFSLAELFDSSDKMVLLTLL